MEFKELELNDLDKVLLELKNTKSKFYIWTCQNDSIVKAEVTLANYNKSRKQIICSAVEGSEYYLQQMVTGMGIMNFYIPEKSIYFQSELKLMEQELIISWPEKLFFNDRRVEPRANDFSTTVEILFEVDGKRYKRNCFDLGTGGLSFTMAPSEKFNFKVDDVIPFINLNINKEVAEISGKVHSIEVIDPHVNPNYIYKATRVSITFIKPDPEFLKKIKWLVEGHKV